MISPILNKLKYKEAYNTRVVNAPDEFNFDGINSKEHIPSVNYDFVLIFVKNKNEVESAIPELLRNCKPETVFWVAYPKKSSPIKTDLSRDQGWESLNDQGYRPVSLVSLSDTWSALRFKPVYQVKSSVKAKTQIFEAIIQGSEDGSGGAWVTIPFDTEEVFGKKGQVKVKATFDGHPYQGSIANMGEGHILIVLKEIRKAIGKQPGDKITVTVKEDKSKREVEIPEELTQLLGEHPQVRSFYESLSYTNRKEYANWIASAKKAETKEKRLSATLEKLKNGIKNPFAK